MIKKLLLIALILSSIYLFPYVFAGAEVLPLPDIIEIPENPPSIFPLETFARLNLGSLYFMLPVGRIERDLSFTLHRKITDMEFIKDFLGVGLELKGKLIGGLYLRLAADMPIRAWIYALKKGNLDLKFGAGWKLAIFTVEGGLIGRASFEEKDFRIRFGKLFFLALGISF